MARSLLINIHAIIPSSRVNGPGARMVVFFQGCLRGCSGCFNPDTHSLEDRRLSSAEGVLSGVPPGKIEGITVSGGEPFLQPEGLLDLLKGARARGLTAVVYTGFTVEELVKTPLCREALDLIDVLIDGGFEEELKETTLLARGSTNQRLHFLSNRYRLEDFYMPGKVEVVIGRDGSVTETGFSRIAAG